MFKPLISIIVPAHDRENTIGYCLKSILNQTYKNFEIIVADDYFTDNTVKIVNSFNDSRIKCIKTNIKSGVQAADNEPSLRTK